jgi:hypothetical protein
MPPCHAVHPLVAHREHLKQGRAVIPRARLTVARSRPHPNGRTANAPSGGVGQRSELGPKRSPPRGRGAWRSRREWTPRRSPPTTSPTAPTSWSGSRPRAAASSFGMTRACLGSSPCPMQLRPELEEGVHSEKWRRLAGNGERD